MADDVNSDHAECAETTQRPCSTEWRFSDADPRLLEGWRFGDLTHGVGRRATDVTTGQYSGRAFTTFTYHRSQPWREDPLLEEQRADTVIMVETRMPLPPLLVVVNPEPDVSGAVAAARDAGGVTVPLNEWDFDGHAGQYAVLGWGPRNGRLLSPWITGQMHRLGARQIYLDSHRLACQVAQTNDPRDLRVYLTHLGGLAGSLEAIVISAKNGESTTQQVRQSTR